MASWFERTRNGKRRFIVKAGDGTYITSIDAGTKGAFRAVAKLVAKLTLDEQLAKSGYVEASPCLWTLGGLLERVERLARAESLPFVRSIRNRLEAGLGEDLQIDSITRGTIDEYQAARLRLVKPRTVNLELGHLRHALRLAREDWHADSRYDGDPFRGWRKAREDDPALPAA